jgi:prevent-host-death family protein
MGNAYGHSQTVTAAEISRNFGFWQNKAISGPVVITHHGHPRAVLMSAERFSEWAPTGAGTHETTPSEVGLSAVIEHTNQAFAAVDAQLDITMVNHVFEDLSGRLASQLVGAKVVDVFPADIGALVVEQLHRVRRSGEANDFEFETPVERDRESRSYHLRAFPFPDGLGVLIENVTELRNGERLVRQAAGLEHALAALCVVGVVRLNLRGFIVETDEVFDRMTGFGAGELVKRPFADMVSPELRDVLAKTIDEMFSDHAVKTIASVLHLKGGVKQPVEISLAAVMRGATPDSAIAAIVPTHSLGG